ncbi:hypothetical protein TcasGA2_TC004517 [Tribolium castaneum]|uniref:Uncharacterized protein n=1 Tax=Tribolium castaneum TaxID=7070 RepID=D6WBM0_TRICA|nr:hypothetical protein TcasGA2_TC004517 [Tribolium castaneum]
MRCDVIPTSLEFDIRKCGVNDLLATGLVKRRLDVSSPWINTGSDSLNFPRDTFRFDCTVGNFRNPRLNFYETFEMARFQSKLLCRAFIKYVDDETELIRRG